MNPGPDAGTAVCQNGSNCKTASTAAVVERENNQTLAAADKYNLQAELELFTRLVQLTRRRTFEGQVAVAATILNRLENERYPNTQSDVIYQAESGRYHYSPVLTGASINRR